MKNKVFFAKNKVPKKVNNRRGRLIIRNLPFSTNEEQLKEHFSKFGEINDVKLLQKPDGKLIGCGFVQFVVKQNAAKAIAHTSGKDFFGRSIVVDWAIPKSKYESIHTPNENEKITLVKEETALETINEEQEIKEEIVSDDQDDIEKPTKTVEDYLVLDTTKIKEDNLVDFETIDYENGINNKRKSNNDDHDENESVISIEKKKRFKSHDVKEGLTVFFKNVSFSVKNHELKQFMKERFGPIYYALVCVDRLTEHSKGTAFVKFRSISYKNASCQHVISLGGIGRKANYHWENVDDCLKESVCCLIEPLDNWISVIMRSNYLCNDDSSSVEACMSSTPEELTLNGSTMEPQMAIDKEVLDKSKDDKITHKDNRNLYLIKEGVIIAGTAAANGVSVHDMNKRLQLEKWKSQVLKNLNMFVARNRLIVHNLPADMDNKKLKDLLEKYSRPNAVLKAVVMRNLKKVDPKGVAISKEYGFVTFKKHEDALNTLRSVNNNPTIFNSNKRPIVAFSIENRLVLQARQRRMDKSKICNPLFNKQQQNTLTAENKKKQFSNEKINKNNRTVLSKKGTTDLPEYTGITAKEGHLAIRPNYKLKIQAEAHQKNVKTKKKITMKKKRDLAIRNEKKREPKLKNTKKNHKKTDLSFSKLVNKYKNKISTPETLKKWYEI